jgi:hypothetical protein
LAAFRFFDFVISLSSAVAYTAPQHVAARAAEPIWMKALRFIEALD